MKTRRFKIFFCVIFKVFVFAFWPVSTIAQQTEIEIVPSNPNTDDNITIELSGTFNDSCIPSNPQVSILGNEIVIDTSFSSADCICLQVLTSWSESVPVGQLSEGTYQVTVNYQLLPASCGPEIEIADSEFNVSQAPSASTGELSPVFSCFYECKPGPVVVTSQ